MFDESIALILPYYGKLPIWFNAFLRSCATNQPIIWLIITDLEYDGELPSNVQFKSMSKSEFRQLAYEKTGIAHDLSNPHKLCDFKPMYGHIFEEYLHEYNYWGHCDMDIIWGNMSSFLSKINYNNYDILSTRKHAISGHFTLYRSKPELNHFYSTVPNYHKAFTHSMYQGFDEGYFSHHLFQEVEKGSVNFKIYWPKRNCLDRHELLMRPNGWFWESGDIKNISGQTGNYLHLIDWKKKIEHVELDTNTNKFYVTQYGIWQEKPFKIKVRSLLDSGIRFRMRHQIENIKSFIKFRILGRPVPEVKSNVLKEYQVLK
ncbi:MAG: hypothetical protein RIA69_06300 [Cyclobacteriaceae bacterium]